MLKHTATGTITVNPIAAISLTSGAGTNNQTKCINVAISNITFAISGGGTGAGVTGLPSGVTGNFSGGIFTISGTPTVAGTFNYTVTTTGTCTQTTAIGTITVNPDAAISLTSGAATNNQTLCANTLMTNITFSISGGGTGAGVTGLPAGISGNFSGGVFTISGTPTVSGSFPYTITTTGTCAQTTATGTITVNPIAAISLTSGAGTNIQTRCINAAISNITYTVSGGGTGAGVIGLPAGVTGNFSGGIFIISGTPTIAGTFNYTVTTTGTCSQTTATGTITVNPNAAISLTSGAGTNNQTLCANTLMTNITFSISGGGTSAGVAGLPAGISGNFSGGIFTISGTPTVSGSFPYTITTTGTCAQTTTTGTITVNPIAVISLTSGAGTNIQTRCINVAISNITFAVSGGGTSAGVTGLPSGVTGNFSGGIFTISGTPTIAGTFNYTVTTTGTCSQTTATGTITVNPNAAISLTSGAGTNNQTLCANTLMTNITFSISGGGTSAGVAGLPAGISGNFSGGIFTISGTPTVSGSFPYTITTTGTCAQTTTTGTITVNPIAVISLTSGAGTNIQTRCINVAISNITFAVSGGGTSAGVTGLPSGVTGNFSGGTFTISGTPTIAGTFNYTVTTTGTCSQTLATGTIIVIQNPTITLTSTSPTTAQNVCRTSPITNITYTIGGGGTGGSITWSPSTPTGITGSYNSGTFTISGTPTAAVAAGTYTYTVTTSGSAPCVNTTATGTITIWVGNPVNFGNGNPNDIKFYSNSNSVCPAATGLRYTVATTTNVLSYQWTLPTGFTITSGQGTNDILVSANGTAVSGVISVIAVNPCGNNSPKTGNITVGPFAAVNVGLDISSCGTLPINLSATLQGAATSITWSAPSGVFDNINSLTAIYTPSITNGSVILTATTNVPNGTCSATSDSLTITVKQPSVAPTSLSTSTSPICNGSSITLSQTGGSLGTGASWKWYSDASFTTLIGTSVAANASLTLSPTATTTYYLRAESSTGAPCAANVAAAGSVTVTVNQPSVAPTSLNSSPNTICNGSSSTLTQTGGSLGTGASWKWYSDAGFTTLIGTSVAANASLSVSPTATITYYLRAESATGAPCTANVPAPGSLTITVNQPSVAPTNLITSASPICNGSSITLTQTGGNLGTGASWKWYSNPGFTTLVGTSAAADASLSLSPAATTTYYLRAESSTGAPCVANVTAAGSVTVTVNQPSVAPTSLNGSPNTICNGSSTTLTQTGGSLGTGASWKWYSDAGFTTLVGTSAVANASLSVSPTATITYYLRAESATGAPCTANVPAPGGLTITVNQPSVAPTNLITSASPICNGSGITLTQTGGSLGTGSSWKWYSNPGFTTLVGTSAAADASLSLNPAATTTYYLRAESSTGAPCAANVISSRKCNGNRKPILCCPNFFKWLTKYNL